MSNKEILALIFSIFLIIHWYWCLYIAYPLVLDKYIRKGQYWLHLPLKWKGLHKSFTAFFTPLLLAAVLLSGTIMLWLYVEHAPLYIFIASWGALISAVLSFHAFCLRHRLRQQEDSYFFIRAQLNKKMEASGKKLSETEMNNLASFQHQNMLRTADLEGKLIKALADQSSQARKSRKQKRT
ncbi:hypothetical protein ACFL5V_01020 [Fibrobacterota bacterium]